MSLTPLNAISPIDGRYRSKIETLKDYFSEEALIKYRVRVEIEYFIALCELPLPQLADFDRAHFDSLQGIYQGFSTADALAIKEIEKTTNHDVKAVEYFIKDRFDSLGLEKFTEFTHLGLTSQGINNTAIPRSVKQARGGVYVPIYPELCDTLRALAQQWKDVPMLARSHGQPASPARPGKGIEVL